MSLSHSSISPLFSPGQIYVTVVGGVAFNFSTCPLFFELAVESAYPCSEVMVGGIMTAMNNFVGLCFLFLFFIPFESKCRGGLGRVVARSVSGGGELIFF